MDERDAPPEGTTSRAERSATRRLSSVSPRLYSVVLAIVALGLAELGARNEWVSHLVLPAPTDVLNALVDGLFSTGLYWEHIASTLYSTTLGFLIAATTAILLAGLLASLPFMERVLLPFVVAFQTLPKIAIAPIVVLWLGFGASGKTTIVVIVCFFPIVINALQGLKIRERDQFELMRSLGATGWQLFRYYRAPNALPYIFAGLHIGVVFALIGAVVAEFVGSRAGLGYILLQARTQFNVPGVFAILFLLMLIGLTLHAIMLVIERRVAFWAEDISVVGT
jgi:NitT/TauT family transport system permease protein